MKFVVVLLLGVGCRQLIGIDDPAVGADAAIDSEVVPDARACFGAAPFEVCVAAALAPFDPVDQLTIDTDKVGNCATGVTWTSTTQPDACFFAAATIAIKNLDVRGSRPLVILATGTLAVDGLVDVASRITTSSIGPGSPSPLCSPSIQVPAGSIQGSGGGGGGSFGSRGGDGGNGGVGGRGLATAASAAPTVLRAGCSGQAGGAQGGMAATGGAGGGAVYLVAGERITLAPLSAINASGAGARPATSGGGGGGGGGSGGMIRLDAPMIIATGARIVANGGGGSGGSSIGTANGGADPALVDGLPPAPGGSPAGNGGTGGSGGAEMSLAQNGAAGGLASGGGGGGGGVGWILTSVPLTGVRVSPAVPAP